MQLLFAEAASTLHSGSSFLYLARPGSSVCLELNLIWFSHFLSRFRSKTQKMQNFFEIQAFFVK
jgi:hypothetical protein